MDVSKNNGHPLQMRPPKSDRRGVSQQGPSNVFNNWISSYQHRPSYQQQQLQPQQQQPRTQMPQYFERSPNSFQQFQPTFQQLPPAFQVPAQQSYQIPYQQVFRQPSHTGYPLQQQQYVFNFDTYFLFNVLLINFLKVLQLSTRIAVF